MPVDAVGLVADDADTETAYASYKLVCDHALAHCAALQDRFALVDVYQKQEEVRFKVMMTGISEVMASELTI